MKIALVHDFLAQDGGAERVLKAFCEIYPEAPIYVWFYDPQSVDPFFRQKDIRTSFIQRLPLSKRRYQWYLPLLPTATDSLDLSGFDVVLSSSSSFVKGVITQPETLHICYCHTPPRYLWTDTHEYVRNLKKNWIIKKILPFYLTRLRSYDMLSANRVDTFIGNSKNVARRIKKYYGRDSVVIHPPTTIPTGDYRADIGNYFLAGGRLMSYKRFDLVIQAFNKLNVPLKIFGTGPEATTLQSIAKSNIRFEGKVSEEKKHELIKHCRAFINPQNEDLGITPIEAMAFGRPVIGYGEGGNLETVVNGVTGVLFPEQTLESLSEIVLTFDEKKFDSEKIHEHAKQFSEENFKRKIRDFVENEYRNFRAKVHPTQHTWLGDK